MTARKKKGVGFLISGIAFVVGGIITVSTVSTPAWFPVTLTVVGLVANFFGFVTVFPDNE